MKKFKRLLAVVLAVAMVVGIVNLPTKASANEVTLELSDAPDAQNNATTLVLGAEGISGGHNFTDPGTATEGVFYNGQKVTKEWPMLSYGGTYFWMSLADYGITDVQSEDVIKIVGQFESYDGMYNFQESSFKFDGTKWEKLTPGNNGPSFQITGVGECGAQPSMNRWLLRLDTDTAIAGAAFGTFVGMAHILVGESAATVEVYPSENQGLGLIVPFASLPQTVAEGQTVTISAGQIGDYILEEAYTIVYSGGEWKKYEAAPTTTKFTITGVGECGPQPNMSRWLLRFNTSAEIEGTAFGTLLGEPNVMVNEAAAAGPMYPTENKGLGVIVSFSSLPETVAEGTTVTIPAGIIGNYELTEAYTMVYSEGAWQTYVPGPSTTKFTITGVGECGAQPNMSRWLLRFNTSAEIEGAAFGTLLGEPNVMVNEAATAGPMYPTENKGLGVIVSFSSLPETVAEGTTVTIPAGIIGNYELTEAYTMVYSEGAWKKYEAAPSTTKFTITNVGGCGAQANMNRWLLRFNTSAEIGGEAFATLLGEPNVLVNDGDAKVAVYPNETKGLCVIVPFAALPETVAEGTKLTVPAGKIGNYELTEAFTIVYSAGEWKKFDASKEYTKFTITGLGNCGAQPDMNRWLLRLNTSAEIGGDAFATLLAEPDVIVNAGTAKVALYPNETKGLCVILPFDVVPETPAAGTTITIPAGFYGDYELTKDFAMYYDNGAWNEKIDESGIQAEKVTFSYFANRDDVLALNIDKIANTLPGEAEPPFSPVGDAKITYNGVQTKNPKMSQFGMYLAVADMTNGAQAKAKFGDKIVISGIWKYTGDNKFYDFGTVTYRYNGGGAWEVFDPSQDVAYDMATPKVYDMFELTNLSTITMREGSQFNLADLKAATNVGMKLMVNNVPGDIIFTLSKDVANNVWVNSGYEIKLVPEVNEIRIITIEPYPNGREDEVIRARVSNMDFSKPFALEFSVADMYKKGTKELIGRCVIAKVNGEEVIRWIDKDLSRKLGHYSAAWSAKETTIDSIGYEGYVPVDKNVGVTDFFDATGYAEKRVTPNECTYLGELGSKNKALKMNVDMTKTTGEFKIALAKKDQTTIWDIEESGYQFWFRPETNQVFIGYGMSEYATMVSHECSGKFVLEIGSKDVYHENGKYYGYMVYVKIDGKEVTSWVDDNIKNRNMGTAIVAYGSANADVVLSTLYNTYELPVVYNVNGEEHDSSDFASVQSKVVLNKPSKITVTIELSADYSMKYKGSFLGEEELTALEIANAPIGVYTYETTASKGDKLVVNLETRELTTDEPTTILDIAEVMGVPSIEVESSKEAPIGSTVGKDGRYRINTAVQMKVEIPSAFNQIRWSMFSDQSSMWGYNGFIVKLLNNKIAICYTATERKLAEFNCDLVKANTTLYVESGAVKCYENGNYKYDRYYVKVGETLESMELAAWFDSRERGSYGTTISAYGMDVPGSYTISSVADRKTITDVSTQANKEKLATNEAFDTTNYAVYYPSNVNANSSAAIKLYTKDGMSLKSLTVAGKNVIADVKKTDDGCYVYDIPKVTSDITFSYVIE